MHIAAGTGYELNTPSSLAMMVSKVERVLPENKR